MRKILFIIRKEFLQLRRDPRMLPILFISPIIQLLILGYAANLDVREIPTIVCDLERTMASRDFLSKFFNSGYFVLKRNVSSVRDVDSYLEEGSASLAFIIPRRFGNKMAADKATSFQVIVDGSDSQSAIIGLNYATMIVARYSRNILLEKFERFKFLGLKIPQVNAEVRFWFNPALRTRNFMIPGVLAMVLMVMTMMLTSMGIVKEKELGTMEQLIVTPVKPYELILGKLLPFVFIGLVDVILVLPVATFWFGVPVKGSVPLLFGLSLVFMMTTLGLGVFISTISRNQLQAMMTAVFFVIPQIILSGFIFPIENMPRIIQYITYIIPLKYFFVIIRGLFLKGVGISVLWDEAVVLFVFGVTILGMSVLRFQKRLG